MAVAGCGSGGLEPRATPSPARAPDPDAPRPALSPDALQGTVVDDRLRPLPGRAVAVGPSRTTTDATGRFALSGVGPSYDLVVAEPNGSRATVYRGLRRRNPLLVHKPADGLVHPSHRASVVGRVEGGPFTQTDWVNLSFASEWSAGTLFLGGMPGARPGPEFGPFMVMWDGPEAISGDLTALRTRRVPAPGRARPSGPDAGASPEAMPQTGATSWLAKQQVTLHDGQTLTVDLDPQPLPRLQTHVTVAAPGAYVTQVGELFVFPISHGSVHAGGSVTRPRASSYDLDIVDARAYGGILCAEAAFGYGQWRFTRSCGIAIDAPADLTLRAPPSFKAPPANSSFRADTTFSWSPVDGRIYELELRDNIPTTTAPAIDIFTTETTATWPDLRALGVGFPTGTAAYYVKIASRGPYATMDDAVGPDGTAASFPKDFWLSESAQVELRVEPPEAVDPRVAQCQFAYGTAIVCGDIPNNIEQNKEFYVLSAMNNKLRYFPGFADAIGIHCVRDCETARAYMKAYAQYVRTYPGFDANAPVEMSGPTPPKP